MIPASKGRHPLVEYYKLTMNLRPFLSEAIKALKYLAS